MDREQVEKLTILKVITGSHGYGLNTPTSDIDQKAVIIEPIEEVVGLGQPWGGKVYSQDGETDFEVYGLRKFLNLALNGNPTVIEILFLTPESGDSRGIALRGLRTSIVSKRVGPAYLGYLNQQRKRMLGGNGNGGHGAPRRDEISERAGFDTKFAMHMLRLGFQGLELLTTGRLALPIEGRNKDYLLSVRAGAVPRQECLDVAEQLERQLREAQETSILPEQPDREAVEKWMVNMYLQQWKAWQSLEDHRQMVEAGEKVARRLAARHQSKLRLPK